MPEQTGLADELKSSFEQFDKVRNLLSAVSILVKDLNSAEAEPLEAVLEVAIDQFDSAFGLLDACRPIPSKDA